MMISTSPAPTTMRVTITLIKIRSISTVQEEEEVIQVEWWAVTMTLHTRTGQQRINTTHIIIIELGQMVGHLLR